MKKLMAFFREMRQHDHVTERITASIRKSGELQ